MLGVSLSIYNLHKNSQTVKNVRPMQKRQYEKSCEIKGGGPKEAVMVG